MYLYIVRTGYNNKTQARRSRVCTNYTCLLATLECSFIQVQIKFCFIALQAQRIRVGIVFSSGPASYPDVSLLMKMCAQRKAGRRQRARRLADLVFKMAARAMADEYAVFKISSALFILRILSKSLPIHVVCMKRKLFSPHTLDSSIIMFTTELHNVYYRTLYRKTTSRGRDSTAFNLMKLPHAKVTAGQEN